MSENTEKLQAARELLDTKKKLLEEKIREYQGLSQADSIVLLDIKEEFIAMHYEFFDLEIRSMGFFKKMGVKTKSAQNVKYMELKMEKDPDTGRSPSNEWCHIKANIATGEEQIDEVDAEIIYKGFRMIRDTAQKWLDQIIQKISVVKSEEFNSRNTGAA